jgi:site-specific DNA recombinase
VGAFQRDVQKGILYYHCSAVCGIRFKAELLNGSYNEKLQQLTLSNGAEELFALVLEDANAGIQKARYLNERQQLQKKLGEEEAIIELQKRLCHYLQRAFPL